MLPMNLVNRLQAQLTIERTNEAFYRALSAAADVVNRPGAKALFEEAANDEASHARMVTDYIVARGERPQFEALEMIPVINGNDYAGMFRLALEREQTTTLNLVGIYWMANSLDAGNDGDAQTVAFLISPAGGFPGFLAEQTNSERELFDHLLKIQRLSEDGLEVFDSSLA
jgi:ferritin